MTGYCSDCGNTACICGEIAADKARRRKNGIWRVYGIKYPMNFEGEKFHGTHPAISGWFWLRCGKQVGLDIRVHGLKNARWIARTLNAGEGKL